MRGYPASRVRLLADHSLRSEPDPLPQEPRLHAPRAPLAHRCSRPARLRLVDAGARLRAGEGREDPLRRGTATTHAGGDHESLRAVLRLCGKKAEPRVRPGGDHGLGGHLRGPGERTGGRGVDGPVGVRARQRRFGGDGHRHRQVRRQAHLSRHRRVQAWTRDQDVAAGRQGQARLLRRRGLHLGLADSHRVVQDARHRSQDLLRLFRRRDDRRQRDVRGERPGRLRDGLRPQPQRHDGVGQARQGGHRGGVGVRPAAQRRHRRAQRLRSRAGQAPPGDPPRHHGGGGQDHPAEPLHGLRGRHAPELQDDRGRGRARGPDQEVAMALDSVPIREYPEPAAAWLSPHRLRVALALVGLVAFYVASWQLAKVNLAKLATGLPKMASWAVKAWPPATDDLPVLLVRAAETVAMAAIGTTVAALLALPVCVLAARNVTPSMALYYPTRWFLNALRGIDSFVFALLFVAAVGLGPFAGVLGIALHTWGSTAKLCAEAIENIPSGALEAAAATGASRVKVLLFAILPDVAPNMVSVALFWWEFNVRASTVLGVVGAGGIGQELKNSMDLLLFPRLFTIIAIILVMVTVIDAGSEWLRRRLE